MTVTAKKKRKAKSSVRTASTEAPGEVPTTPRTGYRLRGLQGKLIDSIGSAIVNGQFKPGEYLPVDRDLCKRYNASRPTIREVIRILEAKGLVQTRQKKGTYVNPRTLWAIIDPDVLAWLSVESLTDELLRDLIELRQLIEPAAAKLAAGRATLPEIRNIQRAYSIMCSAAKDMTSYARADTAFHLSIFAASHNSLLINLSHIVSGLLRLSFELSQETLNDSDHTVEEDLAEHREVMDAISKGDGGAAEATMLRVVLSGKSSLVRGSRR